MTKINQIAQAFAQGVKFAENMKLAMDAAKGKDDEDGHWVTMEKARKPVRYSLKAPRKKLPRLRARKRKKKICRSAKWPAATVSRKLRKQAGAKRKKIKRPSYLIN